MSQSRPAATLLLLTIFLACRLTAAESGPQQTKNETDSPRPRLTITGELKQWHKVTLTLDGPSAKEDDEVPNPFTDYRFEVLFTHESGAPAYLVPGYFAADGDAGNSSATGGNKWRAHLAPDLPGRWAYEVRFLKGHDAAVGGTATEPVSGCHGLRGTFQVAKTDKSGRDFRAKGRLRYVGKRYLQFAGTGEYFLKAGPDSPENLLAYADFDGTAPHKTTASARSGEAAPGQLKTWQPHERDWREGDPTWGKTRGKGLIGALNYLAGKGCTSFSFLTYNAGGDGDDVWPFVRRDAKLHYDCSKLDQWQMVFEHANAKGLFCHFKTQETENDDLNGPGAAQSLDGGDLGRERKLYYRELIARFGHLLALNWNLGEENTQTTAQQLAAAGYFRDNDPYHHLVVVHTYPDWQDKVYGALLGAQAMTGASLQNSWDVAHRLVLKWVRESASSGHPWVVANDEQNPPALGVPPDEGYAGFNGVAKDKPEDKGYTTDQIRSCVLWGSLMSGGAGVEYYFGYKLPQNDLTAQDYRSRDHSWDYCRIALEFFYSEKIPFWEMENADELLGNAAHDNSRYCLAKPGALYLVYLPQGGSAELDLSHDRGNWGIKWFNPRVGGAMQEGTVREVQTGRQVALGSPPGSQDKDWLVLVKLR